MKKPQVLIGLLAALGTTIGVLVAILGLPYGRADYSAFAELYHGPTFTTGVHVAVDSDISNGIATSDANRNVLLGTLSVAVDVTVGNSGGAAFTLGTFNFDLAHLDDSRLNAPAVPGVMDSNPDFNAGGVLADWSCGPPNPDNDSNPLPADPGQRSFISCFNAVGSGPSVVNGPLHQPLARVTYDIPITALAGAVPLVLENVAIFDDTFGPLMNCSGPKLPGEPCLDGQITLTIPPTAVPPTATNTSLPATSTNTSTAIPPTNTPTSTPTPAPCVLCPTATSTWQPSIYKVSEWCMVGVANNDNADCTVAAQQANESTANLFLCETGPCNGVGEGSLIVHEYASGINAPTGLGAYEFSVEYDNFVIKSLNPCDVVFSAPLALGAGRMGLGGVDGILDGEGRFSRGEVAQKSPAPCPAGAINPILGTPNGTCEMSVVLENIIHFGCVTFGQNNGPQVDMDLARLVLVPHEDLRNDIFPGNNNGVVTILKDNGCELVDTLGHPVNGSVGGGLTTACGDLAVTVRILEGDLDLDCEVDLTDAQNIAGRYGAFFGGLLYSKWLDLEPQFHDLDIDIKDIQKVFGRQGSTCELPIPAQPPVTYN